MSSAFTFIFCFAFFLIARSDVIDCEIAPYCVDVVQLSNESNATSLTVLYPNRLDIFCPADECNVVCDDCSYITIHANATAAFSFHCLDYCFAITIFAQAVNNSVNMTCDWQCRLTTIYAPQASSLDVVCSSCYKLALYASDARLVNIDIVGSTTAFGTSVQSHDGYFDLRRAGDVAITAHDYALVHATIDASNAASFLLNCSGAMLVAVPMHLRGWELTRACYGVTVLGPASSTDIICSGLGCGNMTIDTPRGGSDITAYLDDSCPQHCANDSWAIHCDMTSLWTTFYSTSTRCASDVICNCGDITIIRTTSPTAQPTQTTNATNNDHESLAHEFLHKTLLVIVATVMVFYACALAF